MQSSIISLGILLIIFVGNTNLVAQKMSKKEMVKRILALEEENKNLKKDIEAMKAQMQILQNYLPKPGKDTRPNVNTGVNPEGKPDQQVAENATIMEFEQTTHDFGTLKDGESPSYTFVFTNKGNQSLIIQNAKGSCGCTVAKYPKEPIAPNEKGEIQVTFNSKGKTGTQHKSITITANTNPADTRLYIKAVVE